MNKQPFYHRMEVLFTATEDLSKEMNSRQFRSEFARFLKNEFSAVVMSTVTYDGPVDAEPGDPVDLVGSREKKR